MSNRRNFIKTSTYIAAGSVLLGTASCTPGSKKQEAKEVLPPLPKKMEVGIQVYSVRNQLKEDFVGAMKKIAEIGYKTIEGYGLGLDGLFLGKYTPVEYNKIVTDLGMKLISTHCGYFSAEDAPKMIEASKAAGLEYLVVPGLPGKLRESADSYKSVAETFNKVGEQCNAAGIKFGYHNHASEFEETDGQIPMDILIGETEKNLVEFEADLFWIVKANRNPIDLIKKYPGRISLFHVKDANQEKEGETVGKGIIDFKSIFEIGKKSGLKYYFIEDERTDDPFANIKADYDYMAAQDFA